jgi:hypothetical protein
MSQNLRVDQLENDEGTLILVTVYSPNDPALLKSVVEFIASKVHPQPPKKSK